MTTHQHILYESSAAVGGSEVDLSDPEVAEKYADVKNDNTKTNWYVVKVALKAAGVVA